jgi:hypothetical protein
MCIASKPLPLVGMDSMGCMEIREYMEQFHIAMFPIDIP